jgi:hypothetical protein
MVVPPTLPYRFAKVFPTGAGSDILLMNHSTVAHQQAKTGTANT